MADKSSIEERTHEDGSVGKYLVVVCGKCDHESTLLAIVDGRIHMKAVPTCQNPDCGAGLSVSKEMDAAIKEHVTA